MIYFIWLEVRHPLGIGSHLLASGWPSILWDNQRNEAIAL